jgi:hypothetical protein
MRQHIISELVQLLTTHDQEEKRLIALSRDIGDLPPNEWITHDHLERVILQKMVESTDEEINQAIHVYDSIEKECADLA